MSTKQQRSPSRTGHGQTALAPGRIPQARSAPSSRLRRARARAALPVLVVSLTAAAGLTACSQGGGGTVAVASSASTPARSAPAATRPSEVAGVPGLRCTTPPPLQAHPWQSTTVPSKAAAAGHTFVATIRTTCGPLTVELDGRSAPQTVASFLQLAKVGYWAPSPCHRLTTSGIYVLQCGDPTGTGSGTPGYGFGVEHAPADGRYPRGTLAMARTQDPNSNGGQFFVVQQDTQLPTDGGGYSIFGRVTAGLDMVDRIAHAGTDDSNGPGDGRPKAPISILGVSVTEKKA